MEVKYEGQLLTEDDSLYDLSDDSNSVFHFQSVVTTVINGGVRHCQFGELASALDLHTVCDFYPVVTKVPGTDGRRSANDWQVHFQGLTS